MGSFSIWHILIVAIIVLLLFGGNRFSAMMGDVAKGVKSFKKGLNDDIKDVFAEAKVHGFDVKALRTIVRMRKQDANERKEQEAILETYLHALGMLAA